MKKLTHLVGLALVLTAPILHADDSTLTGDAAQRLWEQLPGAAAGPFCTGLCLPDTPCDPPCFSNKRGQGWDCTRTEYLVSHRVEYECVRSS